MGRPREPVVLMYHAFGSRPPWADPHALFVPLEDLDRQLRLLTRRAHPIDLSTFLAGLDGGDWPARSCLVTIDDGYRSVLDAAPLFARHGVPAVLFVPPGHLGGTSGWMPTMPDEPLLDADELRQVQGLGIEVGVHGWDHAPMTGLSHEALARHTAGARRHLEAVLGTSPRSFAYPYGTFDGECAAAVAAAGFEVAFAIDQAGHGRFSVQRRPVTPRDALTTFRVKLLPFYDELWRATATHPRLRRLGATLALQRPTARVGPTQPAGENGSRAGQRRT